MGNSARRWKEILEVCVYRITQNLQAQLKRPFTRKGFYREIFPEYQVRDYGEYDLVIEADHYVDDGQEEGHKNIRWEVLGEATEDTMGENKTVRNFLPTVNNAPAIDWAGKDSIVGTEITYEHPWWNLWTLAPGSKKTETSSETSVMLVAKHRSGRHRFTVYVDYGINGSASDIITHNYSVFLNPGEVWTTSISCPRGSYATVSVSARHNGRPRGKSQGTGYGTSNSSVYFYWQIGIQGPDFGIGESSPIQSQSTNTVSSSDTSTN